MIHRNKQSAVEEYHKAIAKYNAERNNIKELCKRDKGIDVEGMVNDLAKKYNIEELKEKAIQERRSYMKADRDQRHTR